MESAIQLLFGEFAFFDFNLLFLLQHQAGQKHAKEIEEDEPEERRRGRALLPQSHYMNWQASGSNPSESGTMRYMGW